jgi:hypothetical protein
MWLGGSCHTDLESFSGEEGVLGELYHIQRHRRARAMVRLAENKHVFTAKTLEKLLMPIAFHNILQRGVSKSNYDPNIADSSMDIIKETVNRMNTTSALHLFRLVTHQFMPKYPEREKMLIKCIRAMSEGIQTRSEDLQPGQLKNLIDSLKNMVSVRMTPKSSSKECHPHESSSKDVNGVMIRVRPEIVAAVTCLLSISCEVAAAVETVERIVVTCVQGLAARDLEFRVSAREALVSCAIAFSSLVKTEDLSDKVAWIIKTIRARLARGGYQTPVAVFSAHLVFARLLGRVQVSEGLMKEIVGLVDLEDQRWWSVQSAHEISKNTEEAGKQQVLEAKHSKLAVLLELTASLVPDEAALISMFDEIYLQGFGSKWLQTATPSQQQRYVRRVETHLHSVLKGARGLVTASTSVLRLPTRSRAE